MTNYYKEIRLLIGKIFYKFISVDKNGIKLNFKNEKFSGLDFAILFEIAENEKITVLELLKSLNIDRGKITTALNRLINLKLITKTRSDTDKRKYNLCLTNDGKKTYLNLEKKKLDVFEFVLKDMSINEQKTILKFLSKVNQYFR